MFEEIAPQEYIHNYVLYSPAQSQEKSQHMMGIRKIIRCKAKYLIRPSGIKED
jgi:hypothetical protein